MFLYCTLCTVRSERAEGRRHCEARPRWFARSSVPSEKAAALRSACVCGSACQVRFTYVSIMLCHDTGFLRHCAVVFRIGSCDIHRGVQCVVRIADNPHHCFHFFADLHRCDGPAYFICVHSRQDGLSQRLEDKQCDATENF